MTVGSHDKLQQEISELLDRSDELFARSRNLVKDENAIHDGELEAVIEDSARLMEQLAERSKDNASKSN